MARLGGDSSSFCFLWVGGSPQLRGPGRFGFPSGLLWVFTALGQRGARADSDLGVAFSYSLPSGTSLTLPGPLGPRSLVPLNTGRVSSCGFRCRSHHHRVVSLQSELASWLDQGRVQKVPPKTALHPCTQLTGPLSLVLCPENQGISGRFSLCTHCVISNQAAGHLQVTVRSQKKPHGHPLVLVTSQALPSLPSRLLLGYFSVFRELPFVFSSETRGTVRERGGANTWLLNKRSLVRLPHCSVSSPKTRTGSVCPIMTPWLPSAVCSMVRSR